jgi:hypothetical protein
MVNSGELIGTTEYLKLQMRCRIYRCRHNRVRPYTLFSCPVIHVPTQASHLKELMQRLPLLISPCDTQMSRDLSRRGIPHPVQFYNLVFRADQSAFVLESRRALTLWPCSWTFTVQHTIYGKCEYFMNQEG